MILHSKEGRSHVTVRQKRDKRKKSVSTIDHYHPRENDREEMKQDYSQMRQPLAIE